MPLVKINASGTVADAFSIGKSGPTIYQGSSDPADENGTTGDLYIRVGSAPRIFQKFGTGWMVPTTNTGFVREEVHSGDTLHVGATTTYVALRATISADQTDVTTDSTVITVDAGAGGGATIVLPDGYEGQTITIKDEGSVADTNPFTVTANSALIDNAESVEFNTAAVTVQVVFTGGAWWLTARS